jgi:hypothetical protein
LKKFSEPVEDRTRDLPAFSIVLQPTMLLRAQERLHTILYPKEIYMDQGYCRLCFRLRAALLYVGFRCLSLHVSAYMAIFRRVGCFAAFFHMITLCMFSICVLFLCCFPSCLQSRATKKAAKQNPLSI